MLHEVDLLPRWNRYCDGAALLHARSAMDLVAATGVRLPWPLPLQSLVARAQLERDPVRVRVRVRVRARARVRPWCPA